jgi:tRNA threonylcarbamoyl adenosine modification protein YeaZ
MVLVIDTSSARSALALVDGGAALAEDVIDAARDHGLRRRVRALVDPRRLSAVAVTLGPGSFTGLRVGVSYGVGLALGLRVPLLGIGSLELQAARAAEPATALVEAGRGRVYWRQPGLERRLGDPSELPLRQPAVGWLRPATAEAVRAAGVRLLGEEQLRSFAEAASRLTGTARQVGYDTVRLEYMQSFGKVREHVVQVREHSVKE